MSYRTLIVDDESLARDRLRDLLKAEPEIQIVGECADGREAVAAIRQGSPDLIFLRPNTARRRTWKPTASGIRSPGWRAS